MKRGKLLVVAGPSGVGKSSMLAWAKQAAPEIWHSISMTTRALRAGETDGVEYFFVSREEFEVAVAAGGMLEWAEYAGNLYGTPAAPVESKLKAGVSVILEIEVQGAAQVRSRFPDAILIFLAPPSWEELEARLRGRGTESLEMLQARLTAAKGEMAAQSDFDHVVICHSVEQAGAELLKFAADPN